MDKIKNVVKVKDSEHSAITNKSIHTRLTYMDSLWLSLASMFARLVKFINKNELNVISSTMLLT